jgi:hypothetical protein
LRIGRVNKLNGPSVVSRELCVGSIPSFDPREIMKGHVIKVLLYRRFYFVVGERKKLS